MLDLLDRAAIGYVCLPLILFVATWLRWWAALPLIAAVMLALRPAFRSAGLVPARRPIGRMQLVAAIALGCGWAALGGTDHLFFANPDWHIRDAVLHDLVASNWPVGYGTHDGEATVLRTSIAYYLPAAAMGKLAGWTGLPALSTAHAVLALWTALGASLFLAQIFSLVPSRPAVVMATAAVVVLFSGMDIVGALLDGGPRFRQDWNITFHIEWWASSYQYSSMTTQLFWVPNHAIAAWLVMGAMFRNDGRSVFHAVLPTLLVAAALWSPLSVVGLVPFAAWSFFEAAKRDGIAAHLDAGACLATLAVGVAVAGYLVLDPGGVSKSVPLIAASDTISNILRQVQFFMLEAGILGIVLLLMKPSVEVGLALIVLLLLPSFSLGPGNDLVMRASIPALVVLMIATCRALLAEPRDARAKAALCVLLLIGAVTPIAEFARAVMLPAWPINTAATLIGADCGRFPPHYIARVGTGVAARLLREPHALPLGPQGRDQCDNPGRDLMWAFLDPPRHLPRP